MSSTQWQEAMQLWVDLGAFLRTNALRNHLFRTTEIIESSHRSRGSKIWAHSDGRWMGLDDNAEPDAELLDLLDTARSSRGLESRAIGDELIAVVPIGEDMQLQTDVTDLGQSDLTHLERLASEIAAVKHLFESEFRSHRDRRDLETRLRDQARELRRLLRRRQAPVGQHSSMQELVSSASRIATSTLPVLIAGETGTGKEVLARFIHQMSKRPKPMVVVDCGAIPASLLESELFGAERGAFTGATSRIGRFEEADGGTLLLDEIGELPLELQPKLLRVLQDSRIRRVGGSKEIELDLRIIAATHRDLREMVEAGTFREDLYFRLRVVELSVPPLRARADDVILLANHFIRQYCAEVEREFLVLSEEAQDKLMKHDWPGNVRELKNTLRTAILTARGPEITGAEILLEERRRPSRKRKARERRATPKNGHDSRPAPEPEAARPSSPELASRLPFELADWFWTVWAANPEEARSSPWEALEGFLLRAALARSGGSLADAGELVGLTADSFGRHLQKLGGNLAARAISEHPLGDSLGAALGTSNLIDRIKALLLTELLVFCRGNKSEMSRVLGWGRGTLSRELVRLSVVTSPDEQPTRSS